MSELFASTPSSPIARRPDDEEQVAALPPEGGFPSGSVSDNKVADAAPPVTALHLPTDVPEASDAPARETTFDDAHNYQIAQLATPSTSASQTDVGGSPSDQTPVTIQSDAKVPGKDPTENWQPQAVVDKAVATLRASGKAVDPAFAGRLVRLLAREGGFANSSKPKDVTNRGVTQQTLDDIISKGEIKGLPITVKELKPEDYYNIYHDEFFSGKTISRMNVNEIDQIKPGFVDQVFDIIANNKAGVGQELLQKSLNEVGPVLTREAVGDALRRDGLRNNKKYSDQEIDDKIDEGLYTDSDGKLKLRVDKDIGPLTRAIVDIAATAGKIGETNDRLVRNCLLYQMDHSNLKEKPGLIGRTLSLHTPNPPSSR